LQKDFISAFIPHSTHPLPMYPGFDQLMCFLFFSYYKGQINKIVKLMVDVKNLQRSLSDDEDTNMQKKKDNENNSNTQNSNTLSPEIISTSPFVNLEEISQSRNRITSLPDNSLLLSYSLIALENSSECNLNVHFEFHPSVSRCGLLLMN
jgi:hypothetical protein